MIESKVLEVTLVTVRLAGFFVFFPVFNDSRLPRLVKLGLTLSLAWTFVATQQGPPSVAALTTDLSWLRLLVAVVGEVMLGAAIGFVFGILVEPARIAGAYIGQEMGLTMAATTDPSNRQSSNVVSQIIESWVVILFFLMDVHHILIRAMQFSFSVFPIGHGISQLPLPQAAYEADMATKWGLMIASPVGVCLFVTVIALALLMRSVPQMNIFSIGLALRLFVGLTAMIVFLPTMLQLLVRVLRQAESVVPRLLNS